VVSCPRCLRTYDEGVRFCPVDGTLVTAGGEDRNLGTVLLGQFEVRDVCGRGAMGTVYRAYQRNMDRIVAVKILRRELLKEPEVVRRFLREARAAAKLQHPNIVTVHLVGETDDGVPFLVMEHVDGVALEQICEAQGAQPVPRILSLCKQIGDALAEAHEAGIIHRDLKPANILITDRSRVPDLVKVLDFGIAKIVQAADQSVATRDGVIFGTPHYIAPEQATGGEIDHRVDLYSLGVIMFRLATGRLPFEGTAGMQVVLKHLREQAPKPRTIDPTIPPALEALILACLSKDPSLRPKDAESLVMALDRIASGQLDVAPANATLLGLAPDAVKPAVTAAHDARTIRPDESPHAGAVKARPQGVGVAAARPAGKTNATVPAKAQPAGDKPRPDVSASATANVHRARQTTAKVKVLDRESAELRMPAPWWRSRALMWGGAVALLIGTGAGVVAAWLHNQGNDGPVAPPVIAIVPQPQPTPPPELPKPDLFGIKELSQNGFTVRAGFEREPMAGQVAPIAVLLDSAAGPVANAKVSVSVKPPAGGETVLVLQATNAGRYRSGFSFAAGGLYKVRVAATPEGAKAPLVLAFDLDLPATQVKGRSSKSREELPVTIVGPDPAPAPAPARHAPPIAPAPAPVKPVLSGAEGPPVVPTAVIAAPDPAPADPPRARRVPSPAAEPPPDDRPPPPPADPTTVPMPSPDEPR
jgi:serine/threonine-protein kinase